MYGNPYSKFATLHGMIEAYDFVHQWTTDSGQLTSSDVRLMIDGMAPLRYTSLFQPNLLRVLSTDDSFLSFQMDLKLNISDYMSVMPW